MKNLNQTEINQTSGGSDTTVFYNTAYSEFTCSCRSISHSKNFTFGSKEEISLQELIKACTKQCKIEQRANTLVTPKSWARIAIHRSGELVHSETINYSEI